MKINYLSNGAICPVCGILMAAIKEYVQEDLLPTIRFDDYAIREVVGWECFECGSYVWEEDNSESSS